MHRPLLLIGLIVCQGPVGSPRQLLKGFRVAALSVDAPTPETVIPQTAIVVDGKLWSDEAVRLEWYWTLSEGTKQPLYRTTLSSDGA